MTTITAHDLREGRSLVDPVLFQKLAERVAAEHDHDLGIAARIVDQALAFLGTTATHQGRHLRPQTMGALRAATGRDRDLDRTVAAEPSAVSVARAMLQL